MQRPGPQRIAAPGPGHISGPVVGIDRGFMANTNPHRNRLRKTVDASGPYVAWYARQPYVRDERDALVMEPHSMYTKEVRQGDSAGGIMMRRK